MPLQGPSLRPVLKDSKWSDDIKIASQREVGKEHPQSNGPHPTISDPLSIPSNELIRPKRILNDAFDENLATKPSIAFATNPRDDLDYSMRSWLSNRDDYLQFWLSYGGQSSHTQPKMAKEPSQGPHTQPATNAISEAIERLTCHYDAKFHDRSLQGSNMEMVSLLERTTALRVQLHQVHLSSNVEQTLNEVIDKIDLLLLDYDQSKSRQASPGPADGTSRRIEESYYGSHDSVSGGIQDNIASNRSAGTAHWWHSGEPVVDVNDQVEKRPTRGLRCFYFFGPDVGGRTCVAMKKNVRDLIKHWEIHGVFYCAECSQYFQGDSAREMFNAHSGRHENRICIDIECSNKQDGNLYHARVNGCKDLRFGKQKTSRKWYSLFHQALPDDPLPEWNDVEVNIEVRQLANDSPLREGEMAFPASTTLASPATDETVFDTTPFSGLFHTTAVSSLPTNGQASVSDMVPPNAAQRSDGPVVASLRNEITRLRAQEHTHGRIISNYAARLEQSEANIQRLQQGLHSFLSFLIQHNTRLDQLESAARNTMQRLPALNYLPDALNAELGILPSVDPSDYEGVSTWEDA